MVVRYVQAAGSLAKSTLTGTVKYLILHVTPVCNARCRFCFNADGMEERKTEPTLKLEHIQKIASTIGTLPQLTLSGGEPTLRKDVPEIFRAFYLDAGTRFFTIPTNGSLPDRVSNLIESFERDCPNGFFNLCLPFHGDQETFDDEMGVQGFFEKFKETYKVVRNASKRYGNISGALVCVINKYNQGRYREITDLAHSEFPELPLGMHYARGVTRDRSVRDFTIEEYERAYDYEFSQKRNKNRTNPFTVVQESIQTQMSQIISGVVRGEITNLGCDAGRKILVIYDNGTVYPCEMIEVVGIPEGEGKPTDPCMGRLEDFDYDIAALLESPKARHIANWLKTHDCACTWECAVYNAIVSKPASMVRLAVDAVEYMFK